MFVGRNTGNEGVMTSDSGEEFYLSESLRELAEAEAMENENDDF